MKERLKRIRSEAKLTQDKFAEKLQISKNYVSAMEKGNKVPSGRLITSICNMFSINEKWLKDGEGDMYETASGNEFMLLTSELDLSELEDDAYMKGLIEDLVKTWMGLDKERKKVLIEVAKKIEEERKKRQD